MPIVKIRNESVNIDIRAEIEAFEWERPKWSAEQLMAVSPFRDETSPSFYVFLDGDNAGYWGDRGYYDDNWAKGGLVKLLAFLRNETYEETEDYLLEAYGFGESPERQRLITPHLKQRQSFTPLDASLIEVMPSPYLLQRGISAEVQLAAGVGRGKHARFVAIPWYLPDGRLANVKYRATRGKTFFYERGGYPIRQAVYGANLVTDAGECVICEAEIDALSWQTAGVQAVAIGGTAFNRAQADIIRGLPITRLIVAGDNDKAGERFNAVVTHALTGDRLAVLRWADDGLKDANDVLRKKGTEDLRTLIRTAETVEILRRLSHN